jgi:hypothetical protein
MEHKRQRVQFGWLDLKKRRNGPEVWVLRYRETLADGSKRVPSLIVGSIERYPTESRARTASMSLLLSTIPPGAGTVGGRWFSTVGPNAGAGGGGATFAACAWPSPLSFHNVIPAAIRPSAATPIQIQWCAARAGGPASVRGALFFDECFFPISPSQMEDSCSAEKHFTRLARQSYER